jgi:hypothetical protein
MKIIISWALPKMISIEGVSAFREFFTPRIKGLNACYD